MRDESLATWALAKTEGVGSIIFSQLVGKFGSAAAVLEASGEELAKSEIVNDSLARKIQGIEDWERIHQEFEKGKPAGTEFVPLASDLYPAKLRNIADPPPYLFFIGDPGILNKPAIAVVGSRKPSDYGLRMTARIAGELAQSGIVIISGLAYGIDGAAHQAALDAGGLTAAVFGCGLDTIYPAGHSSLARRITETGCLISEFEKGIKPERFNFPVRNRIVAGLAEGVLVIEAAEKSGALVTALLALEQNREVLALPGSVDSKLSYGPNNLIKQGATAITSAQDIFDYFKWHRSAAEKSKAPDLSNLSKEEQIIYNCLTVQPIHLDEINRKNGLGHGKTAEALLNLEMKGFIIRKPGNYVVKA